MERGSFAQPSITFSGFKFIWLHFWGEIHRTQERESSRGDGEKERKTEGENSMGGERKRGKEVESNMRGGLLPESERRKRELVREEWRGGREVRKGREYA